jgi:4-amino-4-deoxy-L-arabinose transferase-like glycosyltransferase
MGARGVSFAHRRAIAAIAVLALVLRLAFIAARDRPLVSDEIDYDRLGWTLASTGHYTDDGAPTAYRPIGYPALVAGVYAVAGHRPGAVTILQAFVDAASTVLLFVLAGGGRLGLLAAGLWAAFPLAILYTDLLMPETAFTAILLAAACLTRRAFPSTALRALTLGALVGTAALLRPAAFLLIAALPLAFRVEGTRITRAWVVLAGVLLVVGPWIVRNSIVLRYPGPVTSTGANLLIGKHPRATGGYSTDIPPEMVPADGPEGRRDLASIASALDYVGREPGPALVMGFAGIAHLFGSEAGMTVWAFHPDPSDPSTRLREKIRSLPRWLHVVVSGPAMAAMILGVPGFFLFPRGGVRAWFLALLGSLVVAHFIFYGGARYHFPLMPFLVLFAAIPLAGRAAEIRPPGRRRDLAMAVAWTCLVGIWAGEATILLRG